MKKHKIKSEFEIDVKRFHLPIVLETKCEKCGKHLEMDLERDYLSNPVINRVEELYMYCDDCDHENYVPIKLSICIEY